MFRLFKRNACIIDTFAGFDICGPSVQSTIDPPIYKHNQHFQEEKVSMVTGRGSSEDATFLTRSTDRYALWVIHYTKHKRGWWTMWGRNNGLLQQSFISNRISNCPTTVATWPVNSYRQIDRHIRRRGSISNRNILTGKTEQNHGLKMMTAYMFGFIIQAERLT